MTPKLYLIVYVGPSGFNWVDAWLTDKKPTNLQTVTRGEGQALLFELVGQDLSRGFSEALQDGTLMKELGERIASFDFKKKILRLYPKGDDAKNSQAEKRTQVL
jgi:hypothetical protein